MKKHLLLFLAPAFLVASCGNQNPAPTPEASSGDSAETSASMPDSAASSEGGLPSFDPDKVSDSLIVHYHRTEGTYEDWALWIWDHGNGGEGSEYLPNALDDYGSVFAYPLSTWSPGNWSRLDLGVIVKSKGSWSAKDPDGDRYLVMSDLNMDENGNYSVWLWTGVTAIYKNEPAAPYYVDAVYFDGFETLKVVSGNGKFTQVDLYIDGVLGETFGPFDPGKDSLTTPLSEPASLTHAYSVKVTYTPDCILEYNIDVSTLYESDDFQKQFNYDGDDLGCTINADETATFKVWSPYSDGIDLKVYRSGAPTALDPENGEDEPVATLAMTKGEKGVWSVDAPADLTGLYYTYDVHNYKYASKEIVDPYARSAGVNGVRGMIIDPSKANPLGWDDFDLACPYDPASLTVYETHVEDVTSHETWHGNEANRGKFLGMTEDNTFLEVGDDTVTTGLAHIKELGVNAVQLQPMFDHANDERPDHYAFNWGYNPLNYNVIEGAYSTDPYDGIVRIREFKTLVKTLHDNGINVIMDVVYNHVGSVEGQNFDVLVPGYYFRYNNGALSNGSGCGNETASDHFMFRKFMIDSATYWMKEYKLGGFRFDLMALHDLETMEMLSAAVKEINPNAAVYGEPWTGGGTTLPADEQASQANGRFFNGYGQFNDQMRDALVRSGMKGRDELGYSLNKWSSLNLADAANVKNGLKGLTGNAVIDSQKTVNYVSCHDNFTLNDRVLAYEYAMTHDQKGEPLDVKFDYTTRAERAQMNLLSQSYALLSQGTSFFLAGEEMLRSKYALTPEDKDEKARLDYAHNSYNTESGFDGAVVNALDYSRKAEFPDLYNNYRQMIALKKNLDCLHQHVYKQGSRDTRNLVEVKNNSSYNQIIATTKDEFREYKFVFTAGVGKCDTVDLDGFTYEFDSSGKRAELTAATPTEHFQILVVSRTLLA